MRVSYYILCLLFLFLYSCETVDKKLLLDNVEIIETRGIPVYFIDNEKYTGRILNKTDDGIINEDFEVKDGLRNGLFLNYYNSGTIYEESIYKNGVLQGYFKSYYPEGELKEVMNYNHNNLNGQRLVYWKNGILKEKSQFINGLLVGEYKFYYSNGKIKKEMYFTREGKKVGTWKDYDSQGKTIRVRAYE